MSAMSYSKLDLDLDVVASLLLGLSVSLVDCLALRIDLYDQLCGSGDEE